MAAPRVFTLILAIVWGPMVAQSPMVLNPPQPLAEQVHTAWSLKEEAPSAFRRIAQDLHGQLWLATGQGAYLFDGMKFIQFRTDGRNSLPTELLQELFVASSGDIWIGYHGGGISQIHDGRITSYTAGIPPGPVGRIAEDGHGAIWAATFGGVAVFRAGVWKAIPWGEEYGRAYNLLVAPDGVVWIEGEHQLLFIRPGSEKVEKTSEALESSWAFAQAPDGRLWVSDARWGLRALDPAQLLRSSGQGHPAPPRQDALRARNILFDHEGRLWGSYYDGPGIFRVLHPERFGSNKPLRHDDADESFGTKEGLTSDTASPLFEDREHNVWVGTEVGLDRFRHADVVASRTVSKDAREGYRAVVGPSGELYVAGEETLYRSKIGDDFKTIGRDPWHPNELCTGRDGVIWLADQKGLRRIVNDTMSTVSLPMAARKSGPIGARKGDAFTCAVDASGTFWLSILDVGLFTYSGGIWNGPLLVPLPRTAFPRVLVAERNGGILAYDRGRSLFLIKNGRIQSFGAEQGLQVGEIRTIVSGAGGTFVGGELGLARLNEDRFESVTSDRYPGLSVITGVALDANGDTWLNSIHGVIELRTDELLRALAQPGLPLTMRRFDFHDGVSATTQLNCCHTTAFTGKPDRVWFITTRGVTWVDPTRLTFNALPPPVLIRSMTVNGQVLSPANPMHFPPSTSNLSFDFAAFSLSIPERVRFRYQLRGWDRDWQDGGNRRQAFYTNLSPGNYRFQVIACNNSGVWNETGAFLDFSIDPAWYQTNWFGVSCIAAVLVSLWGLYKLRMRQLAEQFNLMLEARVSERIRIARELHDTLLQGFQGLLLRFHVISHMLPERPLEAKQELDGAVDRTEQAITESRDAVRSLRSYSMGTNDLAMAIAEVGNELAADGAGEASPLFQVAVEGKSRNLHPLIRDEVYRIATEALRNAFHHAHARRIRVEVRYDDRQFRLRILDDGKGMKPDTVSGNGSDGHYGLRGMHERARIAGGTLAVRSTLGAGTEIELSISASKAYLASSVTHP